MVYGVHEIMKGKDWIGGLGARRRNHPLKEEGHYIKQKKIDLVLPRISIDMSETFQKGKDQIQFLKY